MNRNGMIIFKSTLPTNIFSDDWIFQIVTNVLGLPKTVLSTHITEILKIVHKSKPTINPSDWQSINFPFELNQVVPLI